VIRSKPALMDVMRKAAKKKKDLGQISDYLTSAEVWQTNTTELFAPSITQLPCRTWSIASSVGCCVIFLAFLAHISVRSRCFGRIWSCSASSPRLLLPQRPQDRSTS
jgi:hypothetical protein